MTADWPTEDAINLTGQNGEVDAPVYEVGGTLYRKNTVGAYALFWNGRKWGESAAVTNDMLEVVK